MLCTISAVDFSEGYLIIKMFIVRGAARLRVRQLSLTLEPVLFFEGDRSSSSAKYEMMAEVCKAHAHACQTGDHQLFFEGGIRDMKSSVAIQVLPAVDSDQEVCRIVDEVIAYIASTGLNYYVGPCETASRIARRSPSRPAASRSARMSRSTIVRRERF